MPSDPHPNCECHKRGLGTRVDQILSPEELAELIRDVTIPDLPRSAQRSRRRRPMGNAMTRWADTDG